MAKTLFVIEAPGKVDTLSGLLSQIKDLGSFQIVATRGHFWRMPNGLDPLLIDEHLKEEGREPDEFVKNRLETACEGVDEVVIATDADAEGEVIGRDAHRIVAPLVKQVSRMRFRALALDAVKEAFASRTAFVAAHAYSGDTRRILDRVMGATLSKPEKRIYTGRVQSALLASLKKREPVVGEVVMQLRSADGGRDFIAKVPFTGSQRQQAEDRANEVLSLPPARVGERQQKVSAKPWGFGEAVVRTHVATGMPAEKVGHILQILYETGRMTYPRSSATAVHESTVTALERMAKTHRIKFDRSLLPVIYGNGTDGVTVSHPSPAPLVDVDVTAPLKSLPPEERVLAVVARNLIASGSPQLVEKPDLSSYPEWLRNVEFQRVDRALPWERNLKAKVINFSPEIIAMLAMMQAGVGRPSTLVAHAEKFMGRGLVDSDFHLSEKGEEWLAGLPSGIGKISPALLEHAFDLLPGTPDERIRAIVAMMGDVGAEIVARFEEITGKPFPDLPDRAEIQLKAQKLQESIKLRREQEAGQQVPDAERVRPAVRVAGPTARPDVR